MRFAFGRKNATVNQFLKRKIMQHVDQSTICHTDSTRQGWYLAREVKLMQLIARDKYICSFIPIINAHDMAVCLAVDTSGFHPLSSWIICPPLTPGQCATPSLILLECGGGVGGHTTVQQYMYSSDIAHNIILQ